MQAGGGRGLGGSGRGHTNTETGQTPLSLAEAMTGINCDGLATRFADREGRGPRKPGPMLSLCQHVAQAATCLRPRRPGLSPTETTKASQVGDAHCQMSAQRTTWPRHGFLRAPCSKSRQVFLLCTRRDCFICHAWCPKRGSQLLSVLGHMRLDQSLWRMALIPVSVRRPRSSPESAVHGTYPCEPTTPFRKSCEGCRISFVMLVSVSGS